MSGTFQGRLAYASCAIVAGPAVTITSQSGDFDETPVTPIYTGAGDYLLTLSSPIDPSEACYQITCRASAGDVRVASILNATDTTIRVQVLDETSAQADPAGFDIVVVVKPSN